MKIIVNSAVDAISATSQDGNYPAANLLDEHPKRKWQAADASVTTATITAKAHGKTGGFGLVGVVADHVEVQVSDPSGIVWQNVDWQNVDWATSLPDISATKEFIHNDSYSALWVEFVEFDAPVTINITLSKDVTSPGVLAAGVLVVGQFYFIPGVERPLAEGLQDYSILRPLANGATYYKKRDIVRTFSGTILNERIPFFWKFMRDICRVNGARPLMWKLSDMKGEFIVYARLSEMPDGSHDEEDVSRQNFALIEVL